jgi:EAL and modified HD-GYP domain-containing signal transduction protein
MNSAFFNLPNKITSIKGAVLYLGLNEVRKIVTLLAAAKLAESKPSEIIRTSVMRAKLCELAGEASGFQGDLSELFLMGLFSLMDAILDAEMEDIISQLPLSDNLKNALINKEGELADYLKLVLCYEKGLWNDCPDLSDSSKTLKLTIDGFADAVGWADAFLI